MLENIEPLDLRPGVMRNGTKYQALGRWYDANLVRFVSGAIQPVGGWRRIKDSEDADVVALTGVPRAAVGWRANDGIVRIAFGTHTNLYVLIDGTLTDITPVDFTPGRQDSVYSSGSGAYGDGTYGGGTYGGGSRLVTLLDADTWQLDVFGDFLVACNTSDGILYVWEGETATPAAPAVNAPTDLRALFVTPERFLVALGADGNPRVISWASQETTDVWAADVANTAGDLPLVTNGQVMCGRRTRRQSLIFTDADVHTMTYIGGTFYYTTEQAGTNCGLIAPNGVAMVDSQAFWMSHQNFFVWDGFAKPVPCDVRDFVFSNINRTQAAKIHAQTIGEYNEIWWYYPSATAIEPDSYVVYNYAENHWTVGRLERSTGIDRGAINSPVLVTPDGEIFEHEIGDDRGDEIPYLESGPVQLGKGDNVVRVQRFIPDEKSLGDVTAKLYTSLWPTGDETEHGPFTVGEPTNLRATGRYARLRLTQAVETSWRIGTMSLGIRPQGRR